MNKDVVRTSIQDNAVFAFSRSGGPGGQNVNKVNTKVLATVAVSDIQGLTPSEMARLRLKMGESEVAVTVQDERSQAVNRTIAVERLTEKICNAARIPKKRRPTRPTKASKERRLKLKAIHAEVKKGRRRPLP